MSTPAKNERTEKDGTKKVVVLLVLLVVVGIVASVVKCGTSPFEASIASWISQVTAQAIPLGILVLVLRWGITDPIAKSMENVTNSFNAAISAACTNLSKAVEQIGTDAHPIHIKRE